MRSVANPVHLSSFNRGHKEIENRIFHVASRVLILYSFVMPILLNKTLRLFLDSIGRRDEYEFYLKKFSAAPSACFALICPEGPGFEDLMTVLNFDIDFLVRLELFPAIVLTDAVQGELRPFFEAEPGRYDIWDSRAHDDVPSCIRKSKEAGKVPVLCMGSLSLQHAVEKLVPRISSRIHVLRTSGPLRSENGDTLSYFYASRNSSDELNAEDRPVAEEALKILGHMPSVHLSIASPWNLLSELFTVRGAGCIVRKGSRIEHIQDMGNVDRKRMLNLLEDSFGKPVARHEFLDAIQEVFVEQKYRGAALLESVPEGFYLSKFAVGKEARGEGLAQELWDAMIAFHDRLFWRARLSNPINHWYERHADGFQTMDGWKVFWRGVRTEDLPSVIDYSMNRPDDFS